MEAGCTVVWLVMDNAAFGTIAGLEQMHYGSSSAACSSANGKPYRVDFAAMARACGAHGVMVQSADELGPALREALGVGPPSRHPGADGKCADADARALEYQRHLPQG